MALTALQKKSVSYTQHAKQQISRGDYFFIIPGNTRKHNAIYNTITFTARINIKIKTGYSPFLTASDKCIVKNI
jgi:hypothetical protein